MKIYKIDNQTTLATANCVEFMKQMPYDSVHLTITSPPYEDMRKYKGYAFDYELIIKELYNITEIGGIVVWIVADKTVKGNETGTSFKQALYFKETGFRLFDTMIYLKPPRGASGNNKGYWQAFEYMFVFSKGKPKTINLLTDRPNKESREGDKGTKQLENGTLQNVNRGGYSQYGRRTNVWEYAIGKGHSTKDEHAFRHPAIFPEKLAEDHILSWSNEGQVVFDPMCGSGTFGKMAMKHNRVFVGCDISEEYIKIARDRLTNKQLQIKGLDFEK